MAEAIGDFLLELTNKEIICQNPFCLVADAM